MPKPQVSDLLDAVEHAAVSRRAADLTREEAANTRAAGRDRVTDTATAADEAMATVTGLVHDLVNARATDLSGVDHSVQIVNGASWIPAEEWDPVAPLLLEYTSSIPRSVKISCTFGELVDAYTAWVVESRNTPSSFATDTDGYTHDGLAQLDAETIVSYLAQLAATRIDLTGS